MANTKKADGKNNAIAVRLDEDERAILDIKSVEWDLSISQITRRALRYYLIAVKEGMIHSGQNFPLVK